MNIEKPDRDRWALIVGAALVMMIFFLATGQSAALAIAVGLATVVVGALAIFVVPRIDKDHKEE